MFWVYFFAATVMAHTLCAILLYAKSKELSWALKGAFLGLIAVYLYNSKISQN